MASNQVTIVQNTYNHQYCRFYNGAAFAPAAPGFDAESLSIGGTNFGLWTDANDILYVGKDTTFATIGYRAGTVPVGYGTFTLQYWNGAWVTLTAIANTTAGFTQSGFIAWVIPADWAATTVDTKSAFWIRASQDAAAPGTPATCEHLMRNLTLQAPLFVKPEYGNDRVAPDINGELRLLDQTYTGPTRLTIDCTQLATGAYAVAMPNLTLLWDWLQRRCRLLIRDEAYTSPIGTSAFSTDSYIYQYRGYLVKAPEPLSPSKMDCHSYTLEFAIDDIDTISDRMGVT